MKNIVLHLSDFPPLTKEVLPPHGRAVTHDVDRRSFTIACFMSCSTSWKEAPRIPMSLHTACTYYGERTRSKGDFCTIRTFHAMAEETSSLHRVRSFYTRSFSSASLLRFSYLARPSKIETWNVTSSSVVISFQNHGTSPEEVQEHDSYFITTQQSRDESYPAQVPTTNTAFIECVPKSVRRSIPISADSPSVIVLALLRP